MLAEQLKIYLDKAGIHYAWVMAAMVLLCLAIYLKQFLDGWARAMPPHPDMYILTETHTSIY